MADWRQIQARIRKAKASTDPPGELAQLYEKTGDAMVAFELARLHEKSGQNEEAVRCYTAAAERFRRPLWKVKAEEALTRLGAPIPAAVGAEHEPSVEPDLSLVQRPGATAPGEVTAAPTEEARETGEPSVQQATPPVEFAGAKTSAGLAPEKPHRRRRGRRGGRRRRGQRAETQVPRVGSAQAVPEEPGAKLRATGKAAEHAPEPVNLPSPEQAPASPPLAAPLAWQARGRTGEPALASRLAHLESQLRRLIASPLHRLDEADQAPAGPGVFIVSDSEQTTYYYIEVCQTLRVGVGILLRSERGARRSGPPLRARFAEHLGISESRVSKYLKDHCGVRWQQLDEGAGSLAHFAIAVLRPVLNE